MNHERVQVLIAGAGGAGLSLSLLLLQQGVRPLLVERRDGISVYPRARNLNFRTLEVMRGLGLGPQVMAAGTRVSQVFFRERLASSQEKAIDPRDLIGVSPDVSPDPIAWYCPQSRLEPVLLAAARERGGDVRYGTALASFEQDDGGVTATLEERASGKRSVVRADYLVAADGAHSRIREALGVRTQGVGVLPEYFIFVYFRGPWRELIAGRESDGFVIQNADVQGIFLVAEGDLGMFMINYRPSRGETPADFTFDRCRDLVRKAIGRPDFPVEVVDVAPWQPAESVAEQFQTGRVFLVGDAAHTMPAYKGLGVNTAIQSAQNLAWKLAAVLRGQATAGLLASYHAERHPVGRFAARQSLTGPGAAWLPKDVKSQLLSAKDDLPLFFPIVGYRYRSTAVVSEEASAAPGNDDEVALLDRQELTGAPGTRVPHLWLARDGQRLSTLDLLDGRFVLLAGRDGARWLEAGAAAPAGLDLARYRVGPGGDLADPSDGWERAMGVSPQGAALVRPDGFVAWRSRDLAGAPERVLAQVLARVLSTGPSARG